MKLFVVSALLFFASATFANTYPYCNEASREKAKGTNLQTIVKRFVDLYKCDASGNCLLYDGDGKFSIGFNKSCETASGKDKASATFKCENKKCCPLNYPPEAFGC